MKIRSFYLCLVLCAVCCVLGAVCCVLCAWCLVLCAWCLVLCAVCLVLSAVFLVYELYCKLSEAYTLNFVLIYPLALSPLAQSPFSLSLLSLSLLSPSPHLPSPCQQDKLVLLKISFLLAVFHCSFAAQIVGTAATLSYAGSSNFRNNFLQRISR